MYQNNINILETQVLKESPQKYCQNMDDILQSEILEKILEILAQKSDKRFFKDMNTLSRHQKEYFLWDAEIPLNTQRILHIFQLIKNQKYIPKNRQKYFLDFVNQEANKQEANALLDKLRFQVWKENKDFIRDTFDTQDGHSIVNVQNALVEKVTNYSKILDIFATRFPENIGWNIFIYKNTDKKFPCFEILPDETIIYYDTVFEEPIQPLEQEMFLWKINWVSKVFTFNKETSSLDVLYEQEWLQFIDFVSVWNPYFFKTVFIDTYSASSSGFEEKSWVIFIDKKNKISTQILPEEYSHIQYLAKNILAAKTKNDTHIKQHIFILDENTHSIKNVHEIKTSHWSDICSNLWVEYFEKAHIFRVFGNQLFQYTEDTLQKIKTPPKHLAKNILECIFQWMPYDNFWDFYVYDGKNLAIKSFFDTNTLWLNKDFYTENIFSIKKTVSSDATRKHVFAYQNNTSYKLHKDYYVAHGQIYKEWKFFQKDTPLRLKVTDPWDKISPFFEEIPLPHTLKFSPWD